MGLVLTKLVQTTGRYCEFNRSMQHIAALCISVVLDSHRHGTVTHLNGCLGSNAGIWDIEAILDLYITHLGRKNILAKSGG